MARKTVTYYKSGTRKPRPGVLVGGLSVNGGRVIRVGHSGETYGNATTGILPRVPGGARVNVFVFK